MSYKGLVVEVKQSMLHPHPNANRLQLLKTNGYTIVVGLDVKEGNVGILFGTETPGKLEPWFLEENDLYARRDDKGKNVSKGYFPKTGRVTSTRIRGVRSDGYFHLFHTMKHPYDEYGIKNGDVIGSLNGKLLCSKYYIRQPKGQRSGKAGKQNASSAQHTLMPNLKKHYDTAQLRHYVNAIPLGAVLRITRKFHGTSGRTGHVMAPQSWWERFLSRVGINSRTYTYQSGTRNMALVDERTAYVSHKDAFAATRLKWHERIKHQTLPHGITLYYEIVGYGEGGKPIMAPHSLPVIAVRHVDSDNNLTNDMSIAPNPLRYHSHVEYHYGCSKEDAINQNQMYVYRITHQNDEGYVTEFSYEQIVKFCEDRGFNVVPNIGNLYTGMVWHGNVELFIRRLEEYCMNDEPLSNKPGLKPHPIEGVVIKVEHVDWQGPKALKFKGQIFVEAEGNNYNNGLVDAEEES